MKKNRFNIFYLIGVTLMIVVSIVLLINTYEKKEIINEGIQVIAKVIESPNSCENLGRRPPYCKLKYKNKVFIKNTENNICYLVSQKEFVNVYSNKDGDEIIFLEEYNPMEFLYAILIMIIAIVIGLKKIYTR